MRIAQPVQASRFRGVGNQFVLNGESQNMKNETEIVCPECRHRFRPIDRAWRFCCECLMIVGPDEDWREHKRSECIKGLGTSYIRYTEEEARRTQERRIREYRGVKVDV